MAKTQALDWNCFMSGKVKPKYPESNMLNKFMLVASVIAIESIVLHTVPAFAGEGKAIVVIAPSFQGQLSQATAPIHKLINGFAHEIYGVFMAWGAIETMIGKTQQGFTRMKVATLGYVLLFWVPWIVDTVNGVRPGG